MRLHQNAKADLIRNVPLFAECSKQELAQIAHLADEIDLPEGSRLTREGSAGHEFVVIVAGTADVQRGDEVINQLGPGDFLGEVALLTGQPRSATVVATSPVRALVLAHHSFNELLADAPEVRKKVERSAQERSIQS